MAYAQGVIYITPICVFHTQPWVKWRPAARF